MTLRQLKNRLSQLSAQIEARQKADIFLPLVELPYWLRAERVAEKERVARLGEEFIDDPAAWYEAVSNSPSGVFPDSLKMEYRPMIPDQIDRLYMMMTKG